MSRKKGFKQTEETKERISRAKQGVSRPPFTEEHRNNIAETMKEWHRTHTHHQQGKELSLETKERISMSVRGKGNGNWKGGLTELIRGIRRSPELHQWRRAVLKRDNHTCQDCGNTRNLNAHHLKPVIENPELIFDVANGQTLCRECHKIHTSWYWIKRREDERIH